jgi:putative transposase
VIVVEDLNVAGMVRNHCLGRVISDAAWRMLLTFLAYKCVWYGRGLIRVDRFYPSSKTCSACGHVVERLPLDVRKWTCPSCQTEHDRDVNAAKNILASGLDVARKSKVSGSGVSQHVFRNVLQSELKEKVSVVKPGIRLL